MKNKNKTKLFLTLSAASALGLVASAGQAAEVGKTVEVSTADIDSIGPETLPRLAQAIARALQDPSMRQAMHREIGERFDGDENAILSELFRQSVDGVPFVERLAGDYAQAGGKSAERMTQPQAEARLQEIVKKLPLLQLAVPVHFEKWDAQTPLRWVGVAPVGQEEAETEFVSFYDAQGNTRKFDAHTAPDYPVAALTFNERVSYDSVRTNASATPATKYMYATSAYIEDVDAIEYWVNGDADLQVTVWYGGSSPCNTTQYSTEVKYGQDDEGDTVSYSNLSILAYCPSSATTCTSSLTYKQHSSLIENDSTSYDEILDDDVSFPSSWGKIGIPFTDFTDGTLTVSCK